MRGVQVRGGGGGGLGWGGSRGGGGSLGGGGGSSVQVGSSEKGLVQRAEGGVRSGGGWFRGVSSHSFEKTVRNGYLPPPA